VTSTAAQSCWLPNFQLTLSWFWAALAALLSCPVAVGASSWLPQLTDCCPENLKQHLFSPTVKTNLFLPLAN